MSGRQRFQFNTHGCNFPSHQSVNFHRSWPTDNLHDERRSPIQTNALFQSSVPATICEDIWLSSPRFRDQNRGGTNASLRKKFLLPGSARRRVPFPIPSSVLIGFWSQFHGVVLSRPLVRAPKSQLVAFRDHRYVALKVYIYSSKSNRS